MDSGLQYWTPAYSGHRFPRINSRITRRRKWFIECWLTSARSCCSARILQNASRKIPQSVEFSCWLQAPSIKAQVRGTAKFWSILPHLRRNAIVFFATPARSVSWAPCKLSSTLQFQSCKFNTSRARAVWLRWKQKAQQWFVLKVYWGLQKHYLIGVRRALGNIECQYPGRINNRQGQ